MEKLLARIKALFEPNRPVASPPEAEGQPEQVAPIPEVPDVRAPEPVVAVAEEAPPAEEIPAISDAPVLADAPVVAEAPVVAGAPLVADAPVVAEEAPPEIESAAPELRPGVLELRLENERGSRSTFEVTKSGATIGRGPESTIQLADLSVSRKHAKIAYRQGAYWLSDLGSMGGTWLDGAKLAAPRRVASGQTIDIGVCRLTVVSAGADEEPAATKSAHATSRR
jgi:hypothetical protein